MVTFNALLNEVGIDPSVVKIVRHKDNRFKTTPFSVWVSCFDDYLIYNQIQKHEKFKNADYIASFVVSPLEETLFTNIFRLNGVIETPVGTVCPVSGEAKDRDKSIFYDLTPTDLLGDFSGRIVIDWGAGGRSWVQRAHKQPKEVLEIRRTFEEPHFPGFEAFNIHLNELSSIPESWKSVLRSVHGVYLLVHIDTNQLYVGSAYGSGGIWGRWEDYISNGHGGNLELKRLSSNNYRLSVLKVCSSDCSMDEVTRSENNWKEKLCSRSLGLNAN